MNIEHIISHVTAEPGLLLTRLHKPGVPLMSFDERMQERLRRWYTHGPCSPGERAVADLVNKRLMREYIQARNIPLPRLFFLGRTLNAFNFNCIDRDFVVKPDNSADSDCVLLFRSGKELFSGQTVPKEEVKDFCLRKFSAGRFVNEATNFLIEEFVQDRDPSLVVPRDFKVYAAGGHAWLVQVINRNGPKETWTSQFLFRDMENIRDPIQTTYSRADRRNICVEKDVFSELVNHAERVSEEIPYLLRLDFYVGKSGPVFGEFTTYPFAGKRYTAVGDRMLSQLMEIFPDDVCGQADIHHADLFDGNRFTAWRRRLCSIRRSLGV
jgi:TupA-like ATPgrasp